jgi:transposase
LAQRQIARSCSISRAAVGEYLERAEAAGLSWPLPEGCDDEQLEAQLFRRPVAEPALKRPLADFAHLHEQLQRHKHVTLQLLWEEYRQAHADGYRYSFFCELYREWKRKQDVVLRQEHKAGEKMFVDWAGDTIPVHDRATGKTWQASLFVAVLGASSYTYAEATCDQQMTSGSKGICMRWSSWPVFRA